MSADEAEEYEQGKRDYYAGKPLRLSANGFWKGGWLDAFDKDESNYSSGEAA